MDEQSLPPTPAEKSSREGAWAAPVTRLRVTEVPQGASAFNINGRQVSGPLQGFGPMWQKNYRVRLSGVQATPAQVLTDWKANFADYQPATNRFYPPLTGIKAGDMMFINSTLPLAPGTPGIIPIKSGVRIIYSDEQMFTVATPEGFPISGWNTFSAFEEDGITVAQVQGLLRTTDPIYEFGFRFMGGETEEDKIWIHVLTTLAAHWGVKGQVQYQKMLIDPAIQWKRAGNIWKNAAIRTFFYVLATPFRWVGSLFKKKT